MDVLAPGGLWLLNTDGCWERIFRPLTRRIPWRELGGSPVLVHRLLDRPSLCLRRKHVPTGSASRGAGSPAPPQPGPDGLLNRGVMPIPQLNVYRHDRGSRALLTLAGEIDLDTAPIVRASLEECLRDGIRTIDVDLTTVTFCDCSGLNAFLHASHQTATGGGSLQLHYPLPPVARLLDLTDCGFLLLGHPTGCLPASLRGGLVPTAPAPPQLLAPLTAALSGGVL